MDNLCTMLRTRWQATQLLLVGARRVFNCELAFETLRQLGVHVQLIITRRRTPAWLRSYAASRPCWSVLVDSLLVGFARS